MRCYGIPLSGTSIADIRAIGRQVRFVPILLQKSFWGADRNFSGPLMRFARGDMRDHIVSHKSDHGASYWRYGILRWRSWQKSTFARFSASFDFRLLQQNLPVPDSCAATKFVLFVTSLPRLSIGCAITGLIATAVSNHAGRPADVWSNADSWVAKPSQAVHYRRD
jgi:hypothetical protein